MVVSSSQPMASQPGEMEAHFAALLEPIRDMAKNWDIDVAHHLEEYLEEVEYIDIVQDKYPENYFAILDNLQCIL